MAHMAKLHCYSCRTIFRTIRAGNIKLMMKARCLKEALAEIGSENSYHYNKNGKSKLHFYLLFQKTLLGKMKMCSEIVIESRYL